MSLFHESPIDRKAIRAIRLGRIREELRKRDYAGALLFDPLNIRYATDVSNMQVWCMHNMVRYAFVATDGPVILFDFHSCAHLSADIEIVNEVRPARACFFFEAGPRVMEQANLFADEIADLLREHGGGNKRLAVDKTELAQAHALSERQIEVTDGQEVLETARFVKSDLEIAAMMEAMEACEEGMRRMQAALEPGITENALWSILHQTNIELGGEWIETRLLSSGPRTFPWFQECSQRQIEAGDMVSFDTDLVGPGGYCADISRSWLCGGGPATAAQKDLYGIALEQIRHNVDLLSPGLHFNEFVEKSYQLPDDCIPYRYGVIAHGVGLCDEYPAVRYREDHAKYGYDGVFLPGCVICVESLLGRDGGREAVKLEEQVLITDNGRRVLSSYPFEEKLMA